MGWKTATGGVSASGFIWIHIDFTIDWKRYRPALLWTVIRREPASCMRGAVAQHRIQRAMPDDTVPHRTTRPHAAEHCASDISPDAPDRGFVRTPTAADLMPSLQVLQPLRSFPLPIFSSRHRLLSTEGKPEPQQPGSATTRTGVVRSFTPCRQERGDCDERVSRFAHRSIPFFVRPSVDSYREL